MDPPSTHLLLALLSFALLGAEGQGQGQTQAQAQAPPRYVKPQQAQGQAQGPTQQQLQQQHAARLHQAQIQAQQQANAYRQQQQQAQQQQQQQSKQAPPRQSSNSLIQNSYKKGAPGQGAAKGGTSAEAEYEDYYDDEAKPDRLTEMLKLSKFNCGSVKKDGYYADDSLNCEVFHYCQEGKKHSWMCPEGFGFHQVHLICMPPSADSICAKSSNYHFVNEYLYRPINSEQAAASNTSLKYADRYYPSGYNGSPIDEMEVEQAPHAPRAPLKFGHFYNPQDVRISRPAPPKHSKHHQHQPQSREEYDY